MSKVLLTLKDKEEFPFSSPSEEYVDCQSIERIVFTPNQPCDIYANKKVYTHPYNPIFLQYFYLHEGFRWATDYMLVNMNSIPVTSHTELSERTSPTLFEVDTTPYALYEDPADNPLFILNPYPLMHIDREGIILDVNPALLSFINQPKSEYMGHSIFEICSIEHIPLLKQMFSRTLLGYRETLELDIRLDKGNLMTIHITGIPIFGSQQVERVFGLLRDVTEEKKARELLIKSEKLSIAGQMAAGIAHEIRNPLTSLKGFSQLLKNKAPQYTDYIDIMLTELDRINFIVSELLAVSKPQLTHFRMCHLKDTLTTTIELLSSQAILHNVELHLHSASSVPPIMCDENQLKQVFINFLNNSIDAMPDGGVIDVYVGRYDDKHIQITFVDHGIGIPKERIPLLGEPFYSTKEKGTGLGLMVSFSIIQLHKGQVYFDSELQVGTTVRVVLPINGP